jgi:hypothetical protein
VWGNEAEEHHCFEEAVDVRILGSEFTRSSRERKGAHALVVVMEAIVIS